MSENLKVNSKTDILEFKRKHNLLVDAVPLKDTNGDYKILENIVDAQGHKRFIEGDLELNDGVVPTKTYGKWSLSGTHLMIVLGLSVKENDVIPYTGSLVSIALPKWIVDKIIPLSTDIVIYGASNWLAENNSFQNGYALLRKDTANNILFVTLEGFTANQDRTCRLEFDLLIDNEEPQGE